MTHPAPAGQDSSGEAGDRAAQLSELRGNVCLRVSTGHRHVTREVYVLFGRK